MPMSRQDNQGTREAMADYVELEILEKAEELSMTISERTISDSSPNEGDLFNTPIPALSTKDVVDALRGEVTNSEAATMMWRKQTAQEIAAGNKTKRTGNRTITFNTLPSFRRTCDQFRCDQVILGGELVTASRVWDTRSVADGAREEFQIFGTNHIHDWEKMSPDEVYGKHYQDKDSTARIEV